MTDPHVVALIYRVEHRPTVSYDKAEPLQHDGPSFRIRVKGGRATFEMKEHHATVEAAREAVKPFILAWELAAGLEQGPDEIRFVFEDAEIIDRDPPPGVVIHVPTDHISLQDYAPTIHVGRSRYPSPPAGLAVSPDVRSMYERYCGYRQGKEPLAAMAYFCQTVLEASAKGNRGQRRAAAKKYRIDLAALSTLGRLAAKKGGSGARKAEGTGADFSNEEVKWIEEAVKAIIRRVAEVAHDPSRSLKTITMADLPPL